MKSTVVTNFEISVFILIQTNRIVKCGETMVTLPDKMCKRKCNELVLQPRLRIINIQKYQYDNLRMNLDSDDSIQFNSIYCLPYILYKRITDLETVLANINMHINNNKH